MLPLREVPVLDRNAEALGVPTVGRGVKVTAAPGLDQLRTLLSGADLVVDALLGAGLHGTLRGPYRPWVQEVNASAKPVLSVDVPTGLGTGLAVQPRATVTFHDIKEGMTEANSGRILVADIGIPPRALSHTGPGEMLLYPIPKADQHKGQGGVVLVIGGGPYAGAPALAGMAALRAGANLVIVLAPEACAPLVQGFSPSLIVRPLAGEALDFEARANRDMLAQFLPRATAAVIGNGMGRDERALRSVPWLLEELERAKVPLVVDADALHAVGKLKSQLRREVVLTPHEGEFQALSGEALAPEQDARRVEQARALARRLRCTLIAKGHESIITDGQRVKLNSTGNPAMSTGGSGDVLAGVVGALLGKRLDPFDAARL
ncbi:MAG: NAD(P)H-hydrate dehydratase, partial [Halobacteriales archaeon]|nr:NAD(P)H-hydrate dehydratase [Halobacteriales archaeon]